MIYSDDFSPENVSNFSSFAIFLVLNFQNSLKMAFAGPYPFFVKMKLVLGQFFIVTFKP